MGALCTDSPLKVALVNNAVVALQSTTVWATQRDGVPEKYLDYLLSQYC